MLTLKEHAEGLASKVLSEINRETTVRLIEKVLIEVAKDQRRIIADKIDEETHGCQIGLEGEYALRLAMETHAV